MDRDAVWQAIDAQKSSLADLLDDLSEEEWRQPSLCAGWSVRDVAAHLTLQHISVRTGVAEMVRARGSVDRMIHDAACRRATRPTAELVGLIRVQLGSRRHPPGVSYLEALTDALVHSQDIAVPLGRPRPMPPAVAATAANRVLTMRFPPNPWRRLDDFRLIATDTDWAAGSGPEVRGPMEALLLVLTGRPVALPRLSGTGADALATRLADPTRTP